MYRGTSGLFHHKCIIVALLEGNVLCFGCGTVWLFRCSQDSGSNSSMDCNWNRHITCTIFAPLPFSLHKTKTNATGRAPNSGWELGKGVTVGDGLGLPDAYPFLCGRLPMSSLHCRLLFFSRQYHGLRNKHLVWLLFCVKIFSGHFDASSTNCIRFLSYTTITSTGGSHRASSLCVS